MKNVLFSYPHSSTYVPKEFLKKLNISKKDLILSMDFWTDNFFSWIDSIKIFSQIHFLFWNLNRNISWKHLITWESYNWFNWLFPQELSHNWKLIYNELWPLNEEEKQKVLQTYYIPYYKKLINFILSWKINFVIDVHSCDPIKSWNQTWDWDRPDIILWNLGDENWEVNPLKWYITFPIEKIQKLRYILESYWLNISLNNPFSWWNITQEIWKKIPTLQIEINKKIFMEKNLESINQDKFKKINNILEKSFKEIF